MKLNGIIYTTNKRRWFQSALKAIYKVNSLVKGIEVGTYKVVEIKFPSDLKTKKDVVAVRPDFDWVQENFKQEGAVLCLHITKAEHDLLKLKHPNGSRLGGTYNRNIGDTSLEFIVIADSLTAFIVLFLHEQGHGLSHWSGAKDIVHTFKNSLSDMEALYKTFDFTRWNLLHTLKKVAQLLLIETLKKKLTKPTLPVPFLKITQAYGTYNPALYPSTHYHWGLDLRASKGTPAKAPLDGEVIETGYSKALGYWLQFFDGKHYHVIPHLATRANLGSYGQGEVIGHVSDTGLVTAVHCHLEIWTERMVDRVKQLQDRGWEITIDPATYYNLK